MGPKQTDSQVDLNSGFNLPPSHAYDNTLNTSVGEWIDRNVIGPLKDLIDRLPQPVRDGLGIPPEPKLQPIPVPSGKQPKAPVQRRE